MKISQILKAWLLDSVIFSAYQVLMFVYIVTIIIVFGARIMYDVCISVMSKVVSILHNFYWILGNIKDHITRIFWNFNHLPQKKFREEITTIQCQNTILLDQLPNKVHSIYTLFGMVKRATKPFYSLSSSYCSLLFSCFYLLDWISNLQEDILSSLGKDRNAPIQEYSENWMEQSSPKMTYALVGFMRNLAICNLHIKLRRNLKFHKSKKGMCETGFRVLIFMTNGNTKLKPWNCTVFAFHNMWTLKLFYLIFL